MTVVLSNFLNGIQPPSVPWQEVQEKWIHKLTSVSSSSSSPRTALRSGKVRGIEENIVKGFINVLLDQDVQLACFDFDNTIVNPDHNVEFETPSAIARRICPLFVRLAKELMDAGVMVIIVTYNNNPHICNALTSLLGAYIPVFSRADHNAETFKSWHLDRGIEYFNGLMKLSDQNGLRPKNVLLVDDDPDNAMNATRLDYKVIHNPTVLTLDDLIKYIDRAPSSPRSSKLR